MKTTIQVSGSVLSIILLLFSLQTRAQDGYLPYSAGTKSVETNTGLHKNLELTAGYLPKSGHNGIKASVGVNNILLQRIGVYTSFEYGSESGELMNIIGGNVTVFPFVYVFGGLNLVTGSGVFQLGMKGARKEIGVGITPYKWVVARIGWSNSVGLSVAAGVRIPVGAK